MPHKKLSLKIFILPYICTSIFLFYFFFSRSVESLNFSLISVSLTSFCLLMEIICLKIYKKKFNNTDFCFFSKSLKTIALLCFAYVFLCVILLILNLFINLFETKIFFISLTALMFSNFPMTLFLFCQISFFKLLISFKSKKILLKNPDAIEDIYNSQILIVDKFENFSNLNLINEISKHKKIILISQMSENTLRARFPLLLSDAKFYNISQGELPLFSKNSISVYPLANASSVLNLIKQTNKSIVLISDEDLKTLYCIISNTKTADIYIKEKDMEIIETIFNSIYMCYNNYQKCVTYQITLALAKTICVFSCVFFCSKLPFSPLLLVFSNLVCDTLPGIALIFDKAKDRACKLSFQECFSHVILDSLLLGIVSFIVFMLASFSFSYSCANVICINTFIISSILYAINLRSDKSIFLVGILSNKLTNISFLFGVSATVIITLFVYNDSSQITLNGWILIISMAIIPFVVTQLQKVVVSFFNK